MGRRIATFLALFLGLAFAALFVFRTAVVELAVAGRLSAQGIVVGAIDVTEIGLGEMRIEGLRLGTRDELAARELRIAYELGDLVQGRVETVAIEGLVLKLDLTGAAAPLGSLQALLEGEGGAAPGALPAFVVTDGRIEPHEVAGVRLMSLGFLVERDAPAIWRGPIIMKVVGQFLNDVNWGELDYFIVDLPPGTGDAQLSLVQTIQVSGALVVTTPQEMAVGDALRGAKMFERVNVPVLGVVENMSGFICPHCHERTDIFLTGGGQRLAEETGVPLLAQIPLQPGMADHADSGLPVVLAEPDSPAAVVFKELAETIHAKMGSRRMVLPIIEG